MERIEYKIDIDKSNKIHFYNFLKKKKAKKIFKDRIVNSIYFDNSKLEMYNDTVEGISPRKKIRLRYYGNEKLTEKTNINLEIKYSKPNMRSKISKRIYDPYKYFHQGCLDSQYGICYPITIVKYNRSYYRTANFRVTIDENIEFASFNKFKFKKKVASINEIIVEVKNNNTSSIEILDKEFPFQNTRFSKYCKSIDNLIIYN
jgi:hypothetical protein